MSKIRMIIEADSYEKFAEFLELGVFANSLGFRFKVENVSSKPKTCYQATADWRNANRQKYNEYMREYMKQRQLKLKGSK